MSGSGAAGSPTPIFDKLMEEWQRMFRAVPGDRYGEPSGIPGFGSDGYDDFEGYDGFDGFDGYDVPRPAPIPAFRPAGFSMPFADADDYGDRQSAAQPSTPTTVPGSGGSAARSGGPGRSGLPPLTPVSAPPSRPRSL
ncbi:MAG TPA: hypothetical protein VLH10_04725 [Yinghuangia sp.]|uniref:hypothetical protein n=1 Tax=Yinghuangia sp. YIM S10712 TaxID=3436930 RepID=UPI002CBC3B26|nr:hypothetical protein [Yinghuangia sp.]